LTILYIGGRIFDLLIACLIGVTCGAVTGIIPGIHVNTVGAFTFASSNILLASKIDREDASKNSMVNLDVYKEFDDVTGLYNPDFWVNINKFGPRIINLGGSQNDDSFTQSEFDSFEYGYEGTDYSPTFTYSKGAKKDDTNHFGWKLTNKNAGVGEYIEFNYKPYDTYISMGSFSILNGNRSTNDNYKDKDKNSKLWKEYSRVKKMMVWKNDKPFAILSMDDTMNVKFAPLHFISPPGETMKLKFEILEVYKGSKYNDCIISMLDVHGGV